MAQVGNMAQAASINAQIRKRGKFCTIRERLDKETLDKLRKLRDSLR